MVVAVDAAMVRAAAGRGKRRPCHGLYGAAEVAPSGIAAEAPNRQSGIAGGGAVSSKAAKSPAPATKSVRCRPLISASRISSHIRIIAYIFPRGGGGSRRPRPPAETVNDIAAITPKLGDPGRGPDREQSMPRCEARRI